MMMALAALNAEFISLYEAAALIIGADLGTTSTTILGSIYGNFIKKQLAFAHCFFNFTVDSLAFIFLLPILPLIMGVLRIEDPLYSLVAFHSVINILGLAAFMPFIGAYSKWIKKIFHKDDVTIQSLIQRVPADVADAALAALQHTVRLMCLQAIANSMRLFSIQTEYDKADQELVAEEDESILSSSATEDFSHGYENLKRQEGEVLRYSLKIQAQSLRDNEVVELGRLQSISRAVVYNNKTLKDIKADLVSLKRSHAPGSAQLYSHQKKYHKFAYQQLIDLLVKNHPSEYIREELAALHVANDKHYHQLDKEVYANASASMSDDTLISTQLNINREVHHAFKSMLRSLEGLFSAEQGIGGMSLQIEQAS
jgi:phosphate:Na+ symporter